MSTQRVSWLASLDLYIGPFFKILSVGRTVEIEKATCPSCLNTAVTQKFCGLCGREGVKYTFPQQQHLDLKEVLSPFKPQFANLRMLTGSWTSGPSRDSRWLYVGVRGEVLYVYSDRVYDEFNCREVPSDEVRAAAMETLDRDFAEARKELSEIYEAVETKWGILYDTVYDPS